MKTRTDPPPGGESPAWITLGAAAALLGVSESTVRRWVDAGELRAFRTKGGHRRVFAEDLRHVFEESGHGPTRDAGRVSDIAIARVRRRLGHRRQSDSLTALDHLSPDARARLRVLGRQLVDLFARHMTAGGRKGRFFEDARTIGHEYGRVMVDESVRLSSAIATFNSLRHSLEETASQLATEAGLGVEEAVEAVEETLRLADGVLEGMAEQFER